MPVRGRIVAVPTPTDGIWRNCNFNTGRLHSRDSILRRQPEVRRWNGYFYLQIGRFRFLSNKLFSSVSVLFPVRYNFSTVVVRALSVELFLIIQLKMFGLHVRTCTTVVVIQSRLLQQYVQLVEDLRESVLWVLYQLYPALAAFRESTRMAREVASFDISSFGLINDSIN